MLKRRREDDRYIREVNYANKRTVSQSIRVKVLCIHGYHVLFVHVRGKMLDEKVDEKVEEKEEMSVELARWLDGCREWSVVFKW